MLESLKHEDLQFQELSPEEKQARGILARLSGPIASFTKGTRNGRKYSDKLWEKAFDSPLVKEMFSNGGLPGELQHPADRSETDPTKIAIMMPEPPKKDSNGHLVASVDILDTPCGQIAYQLGKYGFKFGISSRGEGDLIQDFSGEESVDPDTYTLNAFDLVLIPACEDARLQFTESLNSKTSTNTNIRSILSEALNSASDKDRKIMEEAIDELDLSDNYQFVETYNGEDIYFDPETKKYIVGTIDNETILNSIKNAREYIDRYLTEASNGSKEFVIEFLYDEYNDMTDESDHNLLGHIKVRASSESDALQKAKEYLSSTGYHDALNIRHLKISNDNYSNIPLVEEQVGREETKVNTKPSEILQNKSEDDSEDNKEEVSNNMNQVVAQDEEDKDLLEEALTPEEKMDLWHDGKRRENIKACGDRKLVKYRHICLQNGYDKEVEIIEKELEKRGIPKELYESMDTREDDEPKRASWDTDFHRLDVEYNHNFKQFKDMEKESGVIRDFIDDLKASGKDYDIYEHHSDPGCTIFFNESLTKSLTEDEDNEEDDTDFFAPYWEDLNGTEQSAAEAALAEIKRGSSIEDAVHGAVTMYNEANEDDEYSEEDFFMEEADYKKVLDYVKAHENVDESLTEAKMGMYSYIYGVHAHPNGNDRILAGSRDLDEITRSGIKQAKKIFKNPFMTDKEKYDYLDTMYISNDDTEEIDVSPEFDDYVDGLMSELSSRINKSSNKFNEGAITPKKKIPLTAKEFKYTMSYNGESSDINSAVVIIPNGIKLGDGSFMDAVVHCEDTNGEEINFNSVSEAQDWIDTYGDDCLYRIDNGNELYATPSQAYDIDNSEELTEDKYTRDELFDKFGTDNLDIINAGNEETVELADDNDVAMVEQLQNILKQNKSLEEKVKTLQEKLSVGYAKEMELKEEIDTYKQKVSKLSKKTKEIKVLTEKLSNAERKMKDANSQADGKISTLNESISAKDYENKGLKKDISSLKESLSKKDSLIKSLDEQLGKYKDKLNSKQDDIEQLKEQYETGQKDLEQLKNQYAKKVEQQNQIIEKYQRVAKNSVKRYIESQAVRLGVKSDEIVNRLPKNYSFNDIDTICEDLQEYKFNMSNLPFSQYGLNEGLKVTAKNVSNGLVEANPDDEITEYDLKIAEAFL